MPRGGHNKKPDHLKLLQGTLRKGRSNPDAPKLKHKIPRASASLPKEAKVEYYKLVKILNNMKVLSEGDGGELENLSIARAQVKHLSKKLFETSDMEEYRKIQICLNDAVRISAALSMRFGLSPADRDRVSVVSSPGGEPNKFAKL